MAIDWTKAELDKAYPIQAREPQPSRDNSLYPQYLIPLSGYYRACMIPWMREKAQVWVPPIGLTASDHVIIIGAGFGWEQEILEELYPGIDIVSVDTSAYVQGSKGSTETAEIEAALTCRPDHPKRATWLAMVDDGGVKARRDILNSDIKVQQERKAIQDALTSNPTVLITSDLWLGYDDSELSALLPFCDNLQRNPTPMRVVHLSTMFNDGLQPSAGFEHYNARSMTECRALLDGLGLSHHELVDIDTGETG